LNYKDKIEKWIDYISIKRPEINVFPICPFASKAKYEIIESTFYAGLKSSLDIIHNTDTQVVVIVLDDEEYNVQQLESLCEQYNENLMPEDVVILFDHPQSINEINGIKTNSDMTLILVQRLSDLNEANEILKNTKYYDTWSKKYYEKIVGFRV
jgi:hypothetical protein